MALPATENFTGDDDPLTGRTGWTLLPVLADSGRSLSGQYADGDGTGDKGAYWDADTFADGQYSQMILAVESGGNDRLGLIVRASTSTNVATLVRFRGDGDFEFFYWDSGGTRNEIGVDYTPSATVAAGDILRIEIDDATDTITLKVDYGAGFVTETTRSGASGNASGQAGLYIVAASDGMLGDDWEGGDLVPAVSALVSGSHSLLGVGL
tara:strand:- start:852 stop:1481 length:630 start_codon:yes stop_codon:yes gene_type:complete